MNTATCRMNADMGMDERSWVEWSMRATSGLSTVGCMYIIIRFFRTPKPLRDVTSFLVVALAFFELIIAIAKAPATQFLQFELKNSTYTLLASQQGSIATWCQIQAYFIHVFMLQAVLWNNCMAYNLFRWVVYRDSEEKLLARFWTYFYATSGFSILWGLVMALPVWSFYGTPRSSLFGFARFFCWLKFPAVSLVAFISFVVITLIFTMVIMIKIQRVVKSRAKQQGTLFALEDDVQAIQRTLFIYVFAFFCLHLPPVLYRIFLAIGHEVEEENDEHKLRFRRLDDGRLFCELDAWKVFGIMAQICINLQGFVNAIIYGGFLHKTHGDIHHMPFMPTGDRQPSVYLEDASSNITGSGHEQSGINGTTIFSTTFNMAEGDVPPPDQLKAWIPHGHDIYVIGLQECLNLQPMRQAISMHLRTINGRPFVEYGREIGRTETMLGYHGFIAVTVYVSADEVHTCHFQMHLEAVSKVNRGKNLIGLGRASNKGAVGFAFRYFNVTFAVVSCHLASDSTGKSKIKKRHQDGCNILSSMHLQSIENEFDCHLMAHHTIFMGDLNYRLTAKDATPERILSLTASVINSTRRNSAIKRGQVFAHDGLMPKGYVEVNGVVMGFEDDDSYFLTTSPAPLVAPYFRTDAGRKHSICEQSPISTVSTVSVAEPTWKSILDHDELKCSMDEDIVFSDFDEAMISFPPTYRRVLGTMIHADQECFTTTQIAEFYTTYLGEGKVRVPSYTDRILYHSLPGMRERFMCIQYRSIECVGTSDHKPVSCVFKVLLDQNSRRQISARRLATSPCMIFPSRATKQQLQTFIVYMTKVQVHWGPALEKFTSEGEDELDEHQFTRLKSNSQALDRQKSELSLIVPCNSKEYQDNIRIRSLFPLPCEDDFAEERKLAEVANHILHDSNSSGEMKPTWKLSNWSSLTEQGIKHTAVLVPGKSYHLALNFILPNGISAGQCVVSLNEAFYRQGRKIDFSAVLSVGGRRSGEIVGKLCLNVEKYVHCVSNQHISTFLVPTPMAEVSDELIEACTPIVTGNGIVTPVLTRTQSDISNLGSIQRRRFRTKSSKRALFTPEPAYEKRPAVHQDFKRPCKQILVEMLSVDVPEVEHKCDPPINPALSRSLSSPGPANTMEVYTPLLPLIVSTKHPDLNMISPATVKNLLDGEFDKTLHRYHLIDCRFHHEFQGGSLRSAISLPHPQDVEKKFFHPPHEESSRTALIFFCEFSIQRAPKMARYVRSIDRRLHADSYPNLHYPELYVVDGGYKNCFSEILEVCHPQHYIPMNHEDFAPEYKKALSSLRASWKQLKSPLSKQTKWC